jgi:hypothetical protein
LRFGTGCFRHARSRNWLSAPEPHFDGARNDAIPIEVAAAVVVASVFSAGAPHPTRNTATKAVTSRMLKIFLILIPPMNFKF